MFKVLKSFLTQKSWFASRQDPRKSNIREWHTEVYITGPNTNGRQLAFQNLIKNKEKKLQSGRLGFDYWVIFRLLDHITGFFFARHCGCDYAYWPPYLHGYT